MIRTLKLLSLFFTGLLIISSCNLKDKEDLSSGSQELEVDYEKVTLENGLDVILHQDKSDPIVAVAIVFHVGSNREKPGRTGFAHFFEHMLFQRSENVGEGGFFKNINNWGGTFNGFTTSDATAYYEVVPKDALEKILWMESDRMGFFINSVTQASLEGEKPVVKNEKRQRVDNAPYGHTYSVISKALYPHGHPYSWEVIGELEDLQNATLEDVKEFYEQYYGPNNATVVIAGDFDKEKTTEWVEKYFGEIPSRGVDTPMEPQPVQLDSVISLYHEDAFAKLPELRMVYPTVEEYHDDSWALSALGQILSNGKRAPLYKMLVEEKQLAPDVSSYNGTQELAGTFNIRVRANQGVDLDSVQTAIFDALAKFEEEGVNQKDLDRIKAGLETDFYNGISSVLSKAFQLGFYNEYAGSPDFIKTDIANIKSLTTDDVMAAYQKYVKDKPFVATSFVPKGNMDLTLADAEQAEVKEEDITAETESAFIDQEPSDDFERTPSSFDRTVEPPFGEAPLLNPPTIWTSNLDNGMRVLGIEANELPLVNFSIRISGGHLLDNPEKVGVANLMTDIMMEGTKNRTPEELEDAIGQLGANINMYTSDEYITISGNSLSRNYEATLALVQEMLLEPRWDEKEFERIKKSTVNRVQQMNANPNSLANNLFSKKLYGPDNILGTPTMGTEESIESITIEDLKEFYENYFSPSIANFHIAGNVKRDEVINSLAGLEEGWAAKEVEIPTYEIPDAASQPQVFFLDYPGAKQSVIMIGRLTVPTGHEDHYPLSVSNYRLGSGSAGRLFQVMREEKQFTYGAYSYLGNSKSPAQWTAASSVKSSVTPDAMETFKDLIGNYAETYTEEDLQKTKDALIKQNTRKFETLYSLVSILQNISAYDRSLDYIDQEQKILQSMTVEQVQELVNKYMDLNNMVYIIVGDKETQFDRLKVEGAGSPVLVDKDGNPVESPISMN